MYSIAFSPDLHFCLLYWVWPILYLKVPLNEGSLLLHAVILLLWASTRELWNQNAAVWLKFLKPLLILLHSVFRLLFFKEFKNYFLISLFTFCFITSWIRRWRLLNYMISQMQTLKYDTIILIRFFIINSKIFVGNLLFAKNHFRRLRIQHGPDSHCTLSKSVLRQKSNRMANSIVSFFKINKMFFRTVSKSLIRVIDNH